MTTYTSTWLAHSGYDTVSGSGSSPQAACTALAADAASHGIHGWAGWLPYSSGAGTTSWSGAETACYLSVGGDSLPITSDYVAPPPTPPASSASASGGTVAVTCSVSPCAISLSLTPAPVNPEVLTASGVMFGAAMLAGALIWGAKQIYKSFHHHDES